MKSDSTSAQCDRQTGWAIHASSTQVCFILLVVGWCERSWPVLGSYCVLEPTLWQNPPRLIGCGRQPLLAGGQDGRSVEWGCQWLHAAPLMIPKGAPPV